MPRLGPELALLRLHTARSSCLKKVCLAAMMAAVGAVAASKAVIADDMQSLRPSMAHGRTCLQYMCVVATSNSLISEVQSSPSH